MKADEFYAFRSEEAASRMEEPLEDRGQGSSDVIYVSRYGNQRDYSGTNEIKYDQEKVAEWFPGPIPDIALDLIELALAIFAVDKSVKRDIKIPEDDAMARINTRNICLRFPVLSDQLATSSAEELLSTTISRTTRDLIEIDAHQPPPRKSIIQEKIDDGPDAVSMFSGGLDSTGGVFYNRERDVDARYLSLNYGSGLDPLLQAVGDQADIDPDIVGVEYIGNSRESTQFSRGFLHLSFGVAAALGQDIPTVQCFENGLVARFNILQDAWMTTRTVEPEFLRTFNRFLDEFIPADVQVQNPFTAQTKAEVINKIPNVQTVLTTVSCPHSHKFASADRDNCGLCVPCIIRTISILASRHSWELSELNVCNAFVEADFEQMEFDPELEIPSKVDVNEKAVNPQIFLRGVAEIAFFVRHLLNGHEDALARDFPEIFDPAVLELHRNFAKEFEAAINQIVEVNPSAANLLESGKM